MQKKWFIQTFYKNTIKEIEKRNELRTVDESELINKSYEFVDEIELEYGYKKELLESIFNLFEERCVDVFGVPGPLVHYIEKIEGYELELVKSLERKPVFQNLIMIKRILNLDATNSEFLSSKIEKIYNDPNTELEVKELIENIIYE